MPAHPDLEAARRLLQRPLEACVRERLDSPAIVADEMVMVLARMGGLEAGDAVSEVDPLHELELDELVERAIDTRDPDPTPRFPNAVEDLLRRSTALLPAEMLDDGPARASVPEPFGLQASERGIAPGGRRTGHSALMIPIIIP